MTDTLRVALDHYVKQMEAASTHDQWTLACQHLARFVRDEKDVLLARLAPPAPGGDWVTVPRELTDEMLWAGRDAWQAAHDAMKKRKESRSPMTETWNAMLAAAPAPAVERTNPHIGSSFDDFLREEGIAPAVEREPVGDATLWALHIEGPDDVHPAPSREMAQEAADLFNSTFPQSDYPNWPRAVAKVIEWPHGARAHALEAPSFAECWLLSKATREAPRPCGLTLMLACPLPDGHSGRCEYLPPHVRRIADEMEAWSEKKMIGPNSSRIDRTVVREWARQLRGEE